MKSGRYNRFILNKKEIIMDYKRAAKQMEQIGDTNGCVVIALSHMLNISYKEANKIAMEKYDRPFRQGMYTYDLVSMYCQELAKVGKEIIKLDLDTVLKKVNKGSYNVKTVTSNNLKRANLRGMHFAITRSHVTTVKGGKVSDFTTNQASHVQSLYRIQPIGARINKTENKYN